MDFYHRSALILDALDAKKGSVKGLCMAEAKRGSYQKQGEASRFLKVIIETLKYRPHILHLLEQSKLLSVEPTLFVAPAPAAVKSSTPATATKKSTVRSAAVVSKELKQQAWQEKAAKRMRPIPTPLSLATVMVHDLLFAKRGLTLPKEHKIRKKLEKYQPALQKETEKERKRKKVSSNEGLQIPLPEKVASAVEGIGKLKKKDADAELGEDGGVGAVRWLRVNALKWTTEEAVEWFDEQRWELFEDVESMIAASAEKSKVYALDAHIEPLLALPSSMALPSLQPFMDGRLIAQDKASCMPAWVLLAPVLAAAEDEAELERQERAEAGGKMETDAEDAARRSRKRSRGVKVLDATAAPGNKTTMAAAMAGEFGKVVAVERDAGRFKVLKDMCKKAGANNVTPMNTDFLSIDPDDVKFKNISHFLVDPSCSGSGIPSRLDHLIPDAPEDEQKQRIRALSNFQVTILSHAMRFQGARRVVYSTCSIWPEEDEGVVMRILAKKEFKDKGWKLAPRDDVLPGWDRRGIVAECEGNEEIANSVVRCLPEDQSNGFFVACFVRADDGDNLTTVDTGNDIVPADTTLNSDHGTTTDLPKLTHAERQEAFKAKAKQKGGKGGPKGPAPVKPEPTSSANANASFSTSAGASASAGPGAAVGKTVKANKGKAKVKVEGKKAAYLAEKKRRAEAKARGE